MNRDLKKKTPVLCGALITCLFSIYCTVDRLPKVVSNSDTLFITAGLAVPASECQYHNNTADGSKKILQQNKKGKNKSGNTVSKTKNENSEEEIDKGFIKKYGGQAYPVIENQYGRAGEITIKNTTDFNIDVDKELSSPLGFKVEATDKPQVLIVHTHSCEAYLQRDDGVYYSEYSGRSADDRENLTSAGKALADSLTKNGIKALHSMKHHDEPSYNGSYDRSAATIYDYLKKYPSIKVIIDFHRDSIGYGGEDGKVKPTFYANGKKAAQVMIMSGYDPTGEYDYEHWEENLRLALRIQKKAEQLYPGMTRPLYFGDFAYNMNINSGSLLMEVGTEVNTLNEARYTGRLLGEVIAKVLKDEI